MSSFKIRRRKIAVTVADGQTVGSADSPSISGKIRGIVADVPNLTGTTTITLALLDQDGATIYSKASIAESAKTAAYIDANNYPLQIPVCGVVTARVTQTNAQSGADAITNVTLLMEE